MKTYAPERNIKDRVAEAARLAAPIYAAHGWVWGGHGDPEHVPSSEAIAITIWGLYQNALKSERGSSSSGRLSVYVDPDDGSISVDVQLAELRGEVSDWESRTDAEAA